MLVIHDRLVLGLDLNPTLTRIPVGGITATLTVTTYSSGGKSYNAFSTRIGCRQLHRVRVVVHPDVRSVWEGRAKTKVKCCGP